MFIQGTDEKNVKCDKRVYLVSGTLYNMNMDSGCDENDDERVIPLPHEKATSKILEKLVEWIDYRNPTERVVFTGFEERHKQDSAVSTFDQNFADQVLESDKEWFKTLVDNAFQETVTFTKQDVYDLLHLAYVYEMTYIANCLAFYIAKNLEKTIESTTTDQNSNSNDCPVDASTN